MTDIVHFDATKQARSKGIQLKGERRGCGLEGERGEIEGTGGSFPFDYRVEGLDSARDLICRGFP